MTFSTKNVYSFMVGRKTITNIPAIEDNFVLNTFNVFLPI